MSLEKVEAVVIGSGFGGTILTLSLANKFDFDNSSNNTNKKVCLLERGQWWLSHEINYTPPGERSPGYHSNMREFLDDNNRPYHFWPYPDSVRGNIEIASAARAISRTGLYDYRVLGNVHVIASSGVGGGSLVYSNVTLEPHPSVYVNWPTQSVPDDPLDKKFSYKEVYGDKASLYANSSLDFDKVVDVDTKNIDYFDIARNFIGVNKITTNASLTKNKLEKTKVFQEAGQALLDAGNSSIINALDIGGKKIGDFDIDLSITDVPAGTFGFDKNVIKNSHPWISEINKYSSITQTNECQRQGRCNLGCIPGARHTLNKRLFNAIHPQTGNPKPVEIKELCEIYDIEAVIGEGYKISYFQYDKITENRVQKQIMANILIISAGSLGSTELLLKCKQRGHLQLSDILGKKFYTNGDLFAYMTLANKKIDITRGPINTSHISFKKTGADILYTIEDTTIPKIVAPLFAKILELNSNLQSINLTNLFNLLTNNLAFLPGIDLPSLMNLLSLNPLQSLTTLFTIIWSNNNIRSFLRQNLKSFPPLSGSNRKFLEGLLSSVTADINDQFASPEERMSKFFVFSCMGRGENPGNLKLKPDWQNMENIDDPGEKLSVDWSSNNNNNLFKSMITGVKQLAGTIEQGGDTRVFTPLWNFNNPQKSTSVVLHPLGGCNMGKDVDDGVVNSYGQVFWNDGSADKTKVYPKLYVVDGSIIPESLGVNPSLTISALSFRAARYILRDISETPLTLEQANQFLPK
jgi:choline dehydrogenase-like flavoprotein